MVEQRIFRESIDNLSEGVDLRVGYVDWEVPEDILLEGVRRSLSVANRRPVYDALTDVLARAHGLSADRIRITAGANGALQKLFAAFPPLHLLYNPKADQSGCC